MAPPVADHPMNGLTFRAHVEQHLTPTPAAGGIVVRANLRCRKSPGVSPAIAARGAELRYLPPYSPGLNPIGQVFARRKTLVRTAGPRGLETLWNATGQSLAAFTPDACASYLAPLRSSTYDVTMLWGSSMTNADPIQALHRAAAALAETPQPAAAFRALEQAMQEAIGHRLFTVMRHDRAGACNRRVHSSDPAAYPVSGAKPVDREQPWARHVLVEGRAWIGRDAGDIAWAYPDHAKIVAMGLCSAMNLPVRWNGETIGTVNLLHGPRQYTEADATLGMVFAALALPPLLGMDAG